MLHSAFVLIAALLLTPQPSAPRGDLQATLKKLDAASATFKTAEAVTHRDSYNKLGDDHTLADGSTYIIRSGKDVQLGIRIDGPGARIAEYKNGTLRDLIPGKCFDTVSASSNKAKFDSALTLGFGGSGQELAAKWDITDLGPETIEGVKTEKLDLIAKEASVRSNYKKVTLWMDLDKDVSVRQMLLYPTGDTDTVTYSKIRVNSGKVNTGPFEIKGKPCSK